MIHSGAHPKYSIPLILLILALLLGACVLVDPPAPLPGEMPGDAFEQFYEDLGGVEILGPCISPQFEKNGLTYQYTQKVLLVYDPNAPPSQQYTLGEIGYYINLDLSNLPDNGYEIWEEVEPYYQTTGGIAGKAITIVLRNEEKQRYEQYFEGAAFYRSYTDPVGEIYLMDYGDWMCTQCSSFSDGIVLSPTPVAQLQNDAVTQTISDYADRLGASFTGQPVSPGAHQLPDGSYEIIYENIVIATNPENPSSVYLRPLPSLMGYKADPPVPCSSTPDYLCYPLDNGLVYLVPQSFYDYLMQHGGTELSGRPITALRPYSSGVSYQCFENLCLLFKFDAPADLRVSVMQLGLAYNRQTSNGATSAVNEPPKLLIQTWPRYSLLSRDQNQEIWVQATEGIAPVQGALFNVSIEYPDGSSITDQLLPLTDITGKAFYMLDPISAPEGTNIPYTVCYLGINDTSVCIKGVFTIWSTPP